MTIYTHTHTHTHTHIYIYIERESHRLIDRVNEWGFEWLIDLKDISTSLHSFYTKKFGNRVDWTFIFRYFVVSPEFSLNGPIELE